MAISLRWRAPDWTVYLPRSKRPINCARRLVVVRVGRERGLPMGAIDSCRSSKPRSVCATSGDRRPVRERNVWLWGGDYTLDLGMVWSRDEAELLPARSAVVMAMRAPGSSRLWIPFGLIARRRGFARSAEHAARWGFRQDVHHPISRCRQRGVLRRSSVAWARVIAAFERRKRSLAPSNWTVSSSTIPSFNARVRWRREEFTDVRC